MGKIYFQEKLFKNYTLKIEFSSLIFHFALDIWLWQNQWWCTALWPGCNVFLQICFHYSLFPCSLQSGSFLFLPRFAPPCSHTLALITLLAQLSVLSLPNKIPVILQTHVKCCLLLEAKTEWLLQHGVPKQSSGQSVTVSTHSASIKVLLSVPASH